MKGPSNMKAVKEGLLHETHVTDECVEKGMVNCDAYGRDGILG